MAKRTRQTTPEKEPGSGIMKFFKKQAKEESTTHSDQAIGDS